MQCWPIFQVLLKEDDLKQYSGFTVFAFSFLHPADLSVLPATLQSMTNVKKRQKEQKRNIMLAYQNQVP